MFKNLFSFENLAIELYLNFRFETIDKDYLSFVFSTTPAMEMELNNAFKRTLCQSNDFFF